MKHPPVDPDYDALIAAIYQGPLESTPWQGFLPLCRQTFRAHSLSLVLRSPADGDAGAILNQVREDNDSSDRLGDPRDWPIVAYREQFFAMDPFLNLPPGRVFTLEELVPTDTLKQSDYYQQYLAPIGILHILGADLETPNGVQGRFRLSRGPEEQPFSAEEKNLCALLVPHLQRALELHARLNRIESERNLYAGAVGQLALGTLLLDEKSRLLSCNPLAELLLAEQDGVRIQQGLLELDNRQDTQQLRDAIQRVLSSSQRGEPDVVQAMRARRKSGRGELGLIVRPVQQSEWAEGQTCPSVAVFISDPEHQQTSNHQLLAQLFRLTRAESSLATRLARGETLTEAADSLGISPHTARAQLKSIFAKTGVTRQADLIRLLVSSVAALA